MHEYINNGGQTDSNVEASATKKEQELQQILEMFGSVIDNDIVKDYWSGLGWDYEKTILALSEMVDDIEVQNKRDQVKKPPPKEEVKEE